MEVARDEGDKEIKRFCMTSPTCRQFNKNAYRMKMLHRPVDKGEVAVAQPVDTRAITMEESSANKSGIYSLEKHLGLLAPKTGHMDRPILHVIVYH